MGLTYYNTTTLPRLYDIVWCRFPDHIRPSEPGPKTRPALVREVARDTSGQFGLVTVSYGTTRLKWAMRSRSDLIIQNAATLALTGLPSATRFDVDLHNRLPWCEEFFAAPPGWTDIVIGRLDRATIERFIKILRRRGILTE